MTIRPSVRRKSSRLALVSALVLWAGLLPTRALGAAEPPPGGHSQDDFAADDFYDHHHHEQHGPSTGHLAGSVDQVELVGRLKLTSQVGDISDVSAMATTSDGTWYAYLGNWGGFDARNQTPACNSGGVHTGDILVVSNEWCLARSNPKLNPGGFTIYDIDDPTNPQILVDDFGDFDEFGTRANESHSVIAWDAGDGDAYAAAIDNEEVEDVDLFEITDPRNPVLVAETELPGVTVNAHGQLKTAHDFDVLQFPDSSWHLMVSDWDAGWIDVDVTDPSDPTIVGDFDYAECDQVVLTACPPEGNAHQGEWNSDGSLFVGTDEDFSPFRTPVTVLDGPLAGQQVDAGEFSWTKQVASFPGEMIDGPTVFGGYGCPGDPVPDPSVLGPLGAEEEAIIVFQRGPVNDPNNPVGACFFSDKVRAGEEAGYDVVLVANHHAGAQGGETPAAFICGSQGSPVLGTAAGLCVGHEFMHEAFLRTPDYTLPYPLGDPGDLEPNPGDLGPRIQAQSEFDGWGYARVVDTSTPSAPTEVGQITISETADPAFTAGFGDLTVHEV